MDISEDCCTLSLQEGQDIDKPVEKGPLREIGWSTTEERSLERQPEKSPRESGRYLPFLQTIHGSPSLVSCMWQALGLLLIEHWTK